MSFESDLTTLCETVFAERVWWDTSPAGKPPEFYRVPFVIINQVGGMDAWYVDNTLKDFQNARVQFNVWGSHRADVANAMRDLRKAIADSISGDWITMPFGAAVNDFNEVLDLRGSRQDFGFWYRDPLAAP